MNDIGQFKNNLNNVIFECLLPSILAVRKFHYNEEGYEGLIDDDVINPHTGPAPKLPPRRGQSQETPKSKDIYYDDGDNDDDVDVDDDEDDDDDDDYEIGDRYEQISDTVFVPPRKAERAEGKTTKPSPSLPPPRTRVHVQKQESITTGQQPTPGNPAHHKGAKIRERIHVPAEPAKTHEYENKVCPVSPVSKKIDLGHKVDATYEAIYPEQNDTTPTPVRVVAEEEAEVGSNQSYLSIEEIGEVLQRLHLEKHVQSFANEKVDSIILNDFDDDVLKEDFGFTRLETIRLMKYIKTGHIPHWPKSLYIKTVKNICFCFFLGVSI